MTGRQAVCIPTGPNARYGEYLDLTPLEQKGWDTFPLDSQLCAPAPGQPLCHTGDLEQCPGQQSSVVQIPTMGDPRQLPQLAKSLLLHIGS